MNEIKSSVAGLRGRNKGKEKRISEQEDGTIEITQIEHQRGNRLETKMNRASVGYGLTFTSLELQKERIKKARLKNT